MTYSTASDPDTKDGDFVEHFLTDTKIGHSVHYASAAALMFRYYGIPSRYVEGYLATPEDVRDKKSGDTIEIPAKTATHGQRSTLTDLLGSGRNDTGILQRHERSRLKDRSGSSGRKGGSNP